MPMLAKWPIHNLKEGLTVFQVAEKHDWPESIFGLLLWMVKMTLADFVNYNGKFKIE